jgi:hypothetical protein
MIHYIHDPILSSKCKEILYKIYTQVLPVGANIQKFGYPSECPFCGQKETEIHLFVSCARVSQLWAWQDACLLTPFYYSPMGKACWFQFSNVSSNHQKFGNCFMRKPYGRSGLPDVGKCSTIKHYIESRLVKKRSLTWPFLRFRKAREPQPGPFDEAHVLTTCTDTSNLSGNWERYRKYTWANTRAPGQIPVGTYTEAEAANQTLSNITRHFNIKLLTLLLVDDCNAF